MGLPDFQLRVHTSFAKYPDHYVEADGAETWKIVCQFFRWDEYQEETDGRSQSMAN
jgi:hypothetical protein